MTVNPGAGWDGAGGGQHAGPSFDEVGTACQDRDGATVTARP